jgi:hypothetical protein
MNHFTKYRLCVKQQQKLDQSHILNPNINLLKPTDFVHQQFNVQQLYAVPILYFFCIHLTTNSDLCHLQHKLVGFYNRDEKCVLRVTDWFSNPYSANVENMVSP